MKVVIRVDSSHPMGSGHLVRCRTLAEELRLRGADVRFICRDHPGNLVHLLTRSGFAVTVLPASPLCESTAEDYTQWLGVSSETDAAETIEALEGKIPDWLIVDHYGLDCSWQEKLRPQVNKILVIDDLANRPHDCDVLVDQNYQLPNHSYEKLVPHDCQLLLGCHYALLSPEYWQYRQTLAPRNGKLERVLIFLGGTDPQNITGKVLSALSTPEFAFLHLDVVVGFSNPHKLVLQQQIQQRPRTNFYENLPHLAQLMAHADLAIGAGGTTTWERMCLGLPSLVISIAENQVPACLALSGVGAIIYLGTANTVKIEDIQNSISLLLHKPEIMTQISQEGQKCVDGMGLNRIVEILH